MPDTTAPSSTTVSRDPMGARKLRYTIAILCISPILIWQLQNPDSAFVLRLVFSGMLLLGLIRWSAAFLLFLIQLDLYLTTSALRDPREPPALIITFFCVILLMLLSRLRSSQELTGVRSIAQLLSAAVKAGLQPAEPPIPIRGDETNNTAGREMLGIATRALILVLGAGLILVLFLDYVAEIALLFSICETCLIGNVVALSDSTRFSIS